MSLINPLTMTVLPATWLPPLSTKGRSSLPEMLRMSFSLQRLLPPREIGQSLRQHPQELLLKPWTESREAIQASPFSVHTSPLSCDSVIKYMAAS